MRLIAPPPPVDTAAPAEKEEDGAETGTRVRKVTRKTKGKGGDLFQPNS